MGNPKRSTDFNKRALEIVLEATGQAEKQEPTQDPVAVARGRKGGAKDGKARAEALTAERRSEIAKKAARAQWEKQEN